MFQNPSLSPCLVCLVTRIGSLSLPPSSLSRAGNHLRRCIPVSTNSLSLRVNDQRKLVLTLVSSTGRQEQGERQRDRKSHIPVPVCSRAENQDRGKNNLPSLTESTGSRVGGRREREREVAEKKANRHFFFLSFGV